MPHATAQSTSDRLGRLFAQAGHSKTAGQYDRVQRLYQSVLRSLNAAAHSQPLSLVRYGIETALRDVYRLQGRFLEAEELLRKVSDVCTQILGEYHYVYAVDSETVVSRGYIITSVIDNTEGRLKPGMTGKVKIRSGDSRIGQVFRRKISHDVGVDFWP